MRTITCFWEILIYLRGIFKFRKVKRKITLLKKILYGLFIEKVFNFIIIINNSVHFFGVSLNAFFRQLRIQIFHQNDNNAVN